MILFMAERTIVYLSWPELVTADVMLMMFVLCWYNYLSWIFIMLIRWNNSPLVDMLLHSDTSWWFLAKHYLFLFANAACLVALNTTNHTNQWGALDGEIANTNLIVIGLIRHWLEHTIYHISGSQRDDHYTTDAVYSEVMTIRVIKSINKSLCNLFYYIF